MSATTRMKQEIEDLTKRVGYLEGKLTERDSAIGDLQDKLHEKVFPKEVAIEDFESAVMQATKKLVEALH